MGDSSGQVLCPRSQGALLRWEDRFCVRIEGIQPLALIARVFGTGLFGIPDGIGHTTSLKAEPGFANTFLLVQVGLWSSWGEAHTDGSTFRR